ncbi:beta-glucoside operon transcriptional antiterminator [Enterococcus sp. PF1-24]|uniref:PRD domain-containing protein n=1 Tax=unclassified Enterococcus TaxID=2608891 RepID=UPI002476B8C8|nr:MULTISPECIES: PRD domain-containing protein [unclassified Enterococcus]MDH6365003.1 beta-glucoside operon transcriptional antiterminator [Enterococcus sp. PFB1-1]MDH6402104.1 beta-glucoside operon transcriptional antiterminator [Enterococcus sp. PF1-24]
MLIEKRINNNVVLAKENGVQAILMGKGIGFQKYPGDAIIPEQIEKRFYSEGSLTVEQMASLVTNATAADLEVVDEIVNYGQEQIQSPLNPNIYFTILDHMLFSIKRQQKNMEIANPLEWEIKKFYPLEYKIGLKAVDLIHDKLVVPISKNEAAFIALHFVNGQLESTMSYDALELAEMTNTILRLVKYHLNCDFDEESWYFNRFLTHVRYYLMRQKSADNPVADDQSELVAMIFERFPKEKRCVDAIDEYLFNEKGWQTKDIEKMYLILHIRNLVEKKRE